MKNERQKDYNRPNYVKYELLITTYADYFFFIQ